MSAPTEPVGPEPRPGQPAAGRDRWPDVAKGLSILLVVLHHVVGKYYVETVPEPLAPLAPAWAALTVGLKPLRMPVFFLISGFFAASAIQRSWTANRRRIVGGTYLYVVWLVLFLGFYSVERTMPARRTHDLPDLVGHLLWAATSMWFLYALVVYFVLARLTRRVPTGVVLGVAAAVSLAAPLLGAHGPNRVAVLVHLVFFLVGARLPGLVRALGARPWSLRSLTAAYGVALVLMVLSPAPRALEAAVAGVVGIPLAVALAVHLSTTTLGPLLAGLGRRTLRVYVLHLVVIAALVHAPSGLQEGVAWIPVLPLLLAGLVTLACLVLHATLVRCGLRGLFEAPAWLVGGPPSPWSTSARRQEHAGR